MCERSTLSGDKSGHPEENQVGEKELHSRLSDDKLGPPQHFATSGIHSPRYPLAWSHSVTEFGGIQTSSGSSPAFYVSICLSR